MDNTDGISTRIKERWVHGFDDWYWEDSIQCWVHDGYHKYYCLGDRMFHQAFGKTKHHVCFHGSYTDNWHGGIQTESFSEALEWLKGAEGTDHLLW